MIHLFCQQLVALFHSIESGLCLAIFWISLAIYGNTVAICDYRWQCVEIFWICVSFIRNLTPLRAQRGKFP